MACDNIPSIAEAQLAAASSAPISQPMSAPIVERHAAGKAFEEAQARLLDTTMGEDLREPEAGRRDQARATGAGKRGGTGRIDYFGKQNDAEATVIVEMKNSNFDTMKPENVRANVLSHARQLYRYLNAPEVHDASQDWAMLFALYNERPSNEATLDLVERTLAEKGITPVWAEDQTADAEDA